MTQNSPIEEDPWNFYTVTLAVISNNMLTKTIDVGTNMGGGGDSLSPTAVSPDGRFVCTTNLRDKTSGNGVAGGGPAVGFYIAITDLSTSGVKVLRTGELLPYAKPTAGTVSEFWAPVATPDNKGCYAIEDVFDQYAQSHTGYISYIDFATGGIFRQMLQPNLEELVGAQLSAFNIDVSPDGKYLVIPCAGNDRISPDKVAIYNTASRVGEAIDGVNFGHISSDFATHPLWTSGRCIAAQPEFVKQNAQFPKSVPKKFPMLAPTRGPLLGLEAPPSLGNVAPELGRPANVLIADRALSVQPPLVFSGSSVRKR